MKTKTPPPPDTSWTAKGSVFNSSTPDTPCENMPIPITEKGVNVTMPTCKDPMGRPIDADLAIHFIQNYLNDVKTLSEQKGAFHGEINKLENKALMLFINKLIEHNDSIFKLNYGMTLDKNLAFKILSQTGCEGLRFYLCAKKSPKPPYGQQISLVVAGVNCEGYDLNYPKNTCYTNKGALVEADGLSAPQPTSSLPGEYVVPPAKGQGIEHFFNHIPHDPGLTGEEKNFANRFALLNLARKGLPISEPS